MSFLIAAARRALGLDELDDPELQRIMDMSPEEFEEYAYDMGIDTLDFQGSSGRRQFVKFMSIAKEEEMEETEVRQERVDRGEVLAVDQKTKKVFHDAVRGNKFRTVLRMIDEDGVLPDEEEVSATNKGHNSK